MVCEASGGYKSVKVQCPSQKTKTRYNEPRIDFLAAAKSQAERQIEHLYVIEVRFQVFETLRTEIEPA